MGNNIQQIRNHFRNHWYVLFSIMIIFGILLATSSGVVNHVNAASGIIYVNDSKSLGNKDGSSWDDAFIDLQEALNIANAGNKIWIAEGTYYPSDKLDANDDRTATFQMKNGVEIYGGFPNNGDPGITDRNTNTHETILSGDLGTLNDINDNAYHVIYNENLNNTVVLDGVTITDGNADGIGNHSNGGGIYNKSSHPIFNNVTVLNNKALSGAGIYNLNSNPSITGGKIKNNNTIANSINDGGFGGGIYNNNSSPTINNVDVEENTALRGGGIYNIENSKPTISQANIINNKSTYDAGGGIYNKESSPKLHHVTVQQNESASAGAGIYNGNDSNSILTDVVIRGNKAYTSGGGLFNFQGSPELTNVLISGNEAIESGGGIENRLAKSNPVLINVTISGNKAPTAGGVNSSGNMTIYNSILWANSHPLTNTQNPMPEIFHSIIEGSGGSDSWNTDFGIDHGNNIDLNPQFVAHENIASAPTVTGDYQLKSDSPAINAGDSSLISNSISTDLNGNNRFFGIIDMGAFEFQNQPTINEVPVITASDKTILIGASYNPLEGVTANDTEDGDLTSKIKVIMNEVDSSVAGDYKVIFEVTDSHGVTTTEDILVKVKEEEIEEDVTYIEEEENEEEAKKDEDDNNKNKNVTIEIEDTEENNQNPTDVTTKSNKELKIDDNKLPKTATSLYNLLSIGIIILTIGLIIFLIRYRKRFS